MPYWPFPEVPELVVDLVVGEVVVVQFVVQVVRQGAFRRVVG